jgi:catechol 2,3-dioxygenase-like lactoylglutathione lyase family enzyme
MEFKGPLLVVTDMEKSKAFFRETLGLRVIMDFGANVTLTGGIFLQTKDTWKDFINASTDEIAFGGKDGELYFEEDDFDAFIDRIREIEGIRYVHPVMEHQWGQRVLRFFDPDSRIIEVGENIQAVRRRFLGSGMTVEETAVRMDVPIEFVNSCRG